MEPKTRERELGRLQVEVLGAVTAMGRSGLRKIVNRVERYRQTDAGVSAGAVLTTLKRLKESRLVDIVDGEYVGTAGAGVEVVNAKGWMERWLEDQGDGEDLPI